MALAGEGGLAQLQGGVAPATQATLAEAELACGLGEGESLVSEQAHGLELELAGVGLAGHRCPPPSEFTPLTPTPPTLGNSKVAHFLTAINRLAAQPAPPRSSTHGYSEHSV